MSVPSPSRALSGSAFATLLLIAFMMGANHVAARLAFDHGVSVSTAVLFRSGVTAVVVWLIVRVARVPVAVSAAQRTALIKIGLLVALQSLCLYSAVARLPVALALLAFNTYPLWTAFWARTLRGEHIDPRVLRAMPVLLLGLALALDVAGAASGPGGGGALGPHRGRCGLCPHGRGVLRSGAGDHAARHAGARRPGATMALVAAAALVGVVGQGGLALPQAPAGWWGLLGLTLLYGTAFTILFTVLPRLGVVGGSPIMNVEPICALVLAWAVLGQAVAAVQVAGGLLVVVTVMWLGLHRG